MRKQHANEVASDFIDAHVHIRLVNSTLSGGLSTNLGGVLCQKKNDTIKGNLENITHELDLGLSGKSSRDHWSVPFPNCPGRSQW